MTFRCEDCSGGGGTSRSDVAWRFGTAGNRGKPAGMVSRRGSKQCHTRRVSCGTAYSHAGNRLLMTCALPACESAVRERRATFRCNGCSGGGGTDQNDVT